MFENHSARIGEAGVVGGIVRGFPGMVVSSGGIITTSRILGFNQLSALFDSLYGLNPPLNTKLNIKEQPFSSVSPP